MRRTAQSIVKRHFTFPIFVMLIGSILLPIKDAYAGGRHGGGMHGVREEHRDDVHFNHEDHRDDAHDVRRDHFYRVGTRLDTLPGGYTTIGVGGVNYYYLNGAFFRPSGSSYVVVDPPNGAIVPSLTFPTTPVQGDGTAGAAWLTRVCRTEVHPNEKRSHSTHH